MKSMFLLLVFCGGCTKSIEQSVQTDVYPHNPEVIQKININLTAKSTW